MVDAVTLRVVISGGACIVIEYACLKASMTHHAMVGQPVTVTTDHVCTCVLGNPSKVIPFQLSDFAGLRMKQLLSFQTLYLLLLFLLSFVSYFID